MKKIIVTLVATLVATGAFAQFNFGVKVGGNLSTISGMLEETNESEEGFELTSEQAMKLGVNVGAYAEYMIMPLLGVQIEANFSTQGVNSHVYGKFDFEGLISGEVSQDATYSINYINIPVLAKLHFMNIRAYAGPQFGLATGFKGTAETTSGSTTTTQERVYEKDEYSCFDLSLVVGAQYKLTDHIGIDARYNIGLTDLFPAVTNDRGIVVTEGSGRQSVIQLGVFYEF